MCQTQCDSAIVEPIMRAGRDRNPSAEIAESRKGYYSQRPEVLLTCKRQLILRLLANTGSAISRFPCSDSYPSRFPYRVQLYSGVTLRFAHELLYKTYFRCRPEVSATTPRFVSARADLWLRVTLLITFRGLHGPGGPSTRARPYILCQKTGLAGLGRAEYVTSWAGQ